MTLSSRITTVFPSLSNQETLKSFKAHSFMKLKTESPKRSSLLDQSKPGKTRRKCQCNIKAPLIFTKLITAVELSMEAMSQEG